MLLFGLGENKGSISDVKNCLDLKIIFDGVSSRTKVASFVYRQKKPSHLQLISLYIIKEIPSLCRDNCEDMEDQDKALHFDWKLLGISSLRESVGYSDWIQLLNKAHLTLNHL